MKYTILIFILFASHLAQSQSEQPAFTKAQDRLNGFTLRNTLKDNSIVANVPFRSAGPTIFSGRVTDIDVNPSDPTNFYVAYASGGLWESRTNGNSFEPLFDQEIVMTIGDIAVDWNRNIIWVGSGENNSSRSSYSGAGIFMSIDNGKTWVHKGLPESHHIGRILLHPTDTNVLWVGVLGHLYSPNVERGVYKSIDGGDSWTKTLFVNDHTGAVDMVLDPRNPDVLYAAVWDRNRSAWNFKESGEGTGIYKSSDGGDNWELLTDGSNGFPKGEGAGRVGLSLTYNDSTSMLYALIDNYDRRPEEEKKETEELTKDKLRNMTSETFQELEDETLEEFLRSNNFPKHYTEKKVKVMVRKGKIQPLSLVEYLEDANSLLFSTKVTGAEVYQSTDGGVTWKKTHDSYLDDLYHSYGYYFGQIRVHPKDADKIYIMGVPILRSDDGGKSFKSISKENVHVDHHALWINPDKEGHLILGNDGGINISYDDGETWIKCNSPAVGQFYTVNVDMDEPYNIYGGTQDNGVWVGSSKYKYSRRWHSTGKYPFQMLLGGDGMQVQVDYRNNNTVYTGFQFGNYFKLNKSSGKRIRITPKHELGERPLRWNWQTPIHLSTHNQDILYMGANRLYRSMNQGEDFEAISEDLTTGGKKGDVAFSTLTSIHESSLKFGLLYTGSDDGLVHVSRDGGNSWKNISQGLPQNMWVSRIQSSAFEKGRVYVTLNGYRWDDFNAYVFTSEDYGQNWKSISSTLPLEPVNVIREDPVNEDLLYLGTDHATYISLNRGTSWMLLGSKLPKAPVHDLVIHPRDHELVIGTHGRSFYVGDISHIQKLDSTMLNKSLHLFETEPITHSKNWGKKFNAWRDANEPKLLLVFYSIGNGPMTIEISDENEKILYSESQEAEQGLNYLEYDLTIDEKLFKSNVKKGKKDKGKGIKEEESPLKDNGKRYLEPGIYKIRIQMGEESVKQDLEIKNYKK